MLSVVTLIAVMTYMFVAASRELGPFAPIPISQALLHAAAVVSGALAVLVARRMPHGRQIPALAAVVAGPSVLYGVILVTFWTALATGAFMDYFILVAAQRVFVHLVTAGFVSVGSMVVTVVILAVSSR